MTAITVTATTANGRQFLAVRVLTGAAASQPGATATTITAASKAITPTGTGSIIYGAYSNASSLYPHTGLAGTTVVSEADSGGSQDEVTMASAGTTAGTPVTVGVVTKGETAFALALAEILGTPVEDSSTPPPVPANGTFNLPTAATLTTASFTPPAGALLVALTTSSGGAPTVSDSSGLTWTLAAAANDPGSFHWAAIWTAVFPGSGSTSQLKEDASTPAVTHTPYGASRTGTSVPFAPPANSLVVVGVNVLCPGGGASLAGPGCTDSLGNAYTLRCSIQAVGGVTVSAFYAYRYWGQQAPLTVSVTDLTGTGSRDFQISVRVLTGTALSQAGAAAPTFQAGGGVFLDQTVTTTQATSWVYIAAGAGSTAQATPDTGTTTLDWFGDAAQSGHSGYAGRCQPGGAAGPVVMGWGNSTIAGTTWAGLEILPGPVPVPASGSSSAITDTDTTTTTVT